MLTLTVTFVVELLVFCKFSALLETWPVYDRMAYSGIHVT